jgi:ABC-type microcin C transport system duplicated ATPase subunit YejF
MNPDAAILIENVTRSYAVSAGFARPTRNLVAVDDISLSVRAGSTLGIVGESGCGKSTLAQMIVGLLAPTSGRILVDGQSLAAMDRRKRAKLIQLVPQDPFSSLNPKRRIRDNIALPLRAQAELPGKAQMERVREMMERVGLRADMGDRYPAELSGGQRQRVAIARALVNDPRGGVRRADLRTRRLGSGANPQSAGEIAAGAEPHSGVHQPQPVGRRICLDGSGGDVSWPHRRIRHRRRPVPQFPPSLQ